MDRVAVRIMVVGRFRVCREGHGAQARTQRWSRQGAGQGHRKAGQT